MSEFLPILATVLGIGLLIFVHEAGHYLCARLIGVRVLVFSLGFGPRLWGFVRNGTDYRLAAVPLGGYVRVAGDDPEDQVFQAPDHLGAKSVPARLLFFAGGAAMNLVFALIAFGIAFRAGVAFHAPVVGDVTVGGPAWEQGLRPGDRICKVDGKEMYSFPNLVNEVALAGDREVDLVVERDGEKLEKTARPRYDEQMGIYRLGIEPASEPWIRLRVPTDSPAWAAGLRDGDQLVAVDGEPVDPGNYLHVLLATRDLKAPVQLSVLREGEGEQTIRYQPKIVDREQALIGVTPASRRVLGLRPGLRPLDELGLRRGDRVVAIDGKRFAGDGLEPYAEGPDHLTVTVLRDGDHVTLGPVPITAAERRALPDHVGLGMDRTGVAVVPQPGSPAARAGIEAGDEILRLGNHVLNDWGDLIEAVHDTPRGSEQKLLVRTAKGDVELSLEPSFRERDLGVVFETAPLREINRKDSVGAALKAGLVSSVDLIKSFYVTLKKLFTGEVAARNLGGIISISRITYGYAQSGWERLLYFLALLSINLAFINVLPIPVLDGGHMMFVAIEGIKGSPVSPRVMGYSQILGLVFIVALLVFVTYNDILRLL